MSETDKRYPVGIIGPLDPVLFASQEGKELCFPVIVDPVVNEITTSVGPFKIIPVDYTRRGIALQVYSIPTLLGAYSKYAPSLKNKLNHHVLIPGTFITIRGDNWDTPHHFPIAAALLIVGRDGKMYLKRDGEDKRTELSPSCVQESVIEVATKIAEIYKEVHGDPATEEPEFFTAQ